MEVKKKNNKKKVDCIFSNCDKKKINELANSAPDF